MMNDKDLQRKMKEQQIKKLMNELLDSYEDELPKIDEKMAKKIIMAKKFAEEKVNELKLEKDSRSEKYRIADMLARINNNENVLDMLGFVGFNDGNGFVFGNRNMGNNTVNILSFMIADVFEHIMSDKADDIDFEDFLQNLIYNTRAMWMSKRGLSER